MTDRELIKKARAGDDKAFEELVRRYESQIAATVHGMLGNVDVADDVGQEVFIRFHKNMSRFREDAALATYLTRIAINLCINELNRRKRRSLLFKSPEEANLLEPSGTPDDSIVRNERKEIVQTAIQELEPKFRSVVVLRLIEGYSTEETAKILEIPLGTVLSRLARSQKKLKEKLVPFIQEEI